MAQPISHRKEKLPELLQHLAAQFVQQESNGTSLITITGSSISDNQRRVVIFFTVLPVEKENDVKLFLERKKKDFFEFVDTRARIGRMPEIQFNLDTGEKNRQRIDFLLQSD